MVAVQLKWAGNARGGELAAPRRPDVLLIAVGAAGFLAGIVAVWVTISTARCAWSLSAW